MNAQNIMDAIEETAEITEDPATVAALRGIVARAKRYEAQEAHHAFLKAKALEASGDARNG